MAPIEESAIRKADTPTTHGSICVNAPDEPSVPAPISNRKTQSFSSHNINLLTKQKMQLLCFPSFHILKIK